MSGRRAWPVLALVGMVLALVLAARDQALHLIRPELLMTRYEGHAPGPGGSGADGRRVPFYNDALSPGVITGIAFKHFGLKADRGLPILELPGAMPGDAIIVGAPPKAFRFAYVTSMGFVWSNAMPSWMPKVYGDGWFWTKDWRARVWPKEGPELRVEISNGLEFIECIESTAGDPAGLLVCPDRPELVVSLRPAVQPVEVRVASPDLSEMIFQREYPWQDDSSVGGSRYYLDRVLKSRANGTGSYLAMQYSRNYPTPPLGSRGGLSDDARIFYVMEARPTGSADAVRYETSYTRLLWKDVRYPTNDCRYGGPDVKPQCPDSEVCYDKKCGPDRSQTAASPLNRLAKMVMPTPIAPGVPDPLVYSFYYGYDKANGLPWLSTIEDNRGPRGSNGLMPPGPSGGNAVQFGYDYLRVGRELNAVSSENGFDRGSARFEPTDHAIYQRVWTTLAKPFYINYFSLAPDPAFPERYGWRVSVVDSMGLRTERDYEAIGDLPDATKSCPHVHGCNIQWGLKRKVQPDGATSTYDYFPGQEAGRTVLGGFLRSSSAQGIVTTYTRDPATALVTREETGCLGTKFAYGDSRFKAVPTLVTRFSLQNGQDTPLRTETTRLCSAPGCPVTDYGTPLSSITASANRPGSDITVTTVHGAGDKEVRMTSGPDVETLSMALGRDPAHGIAHEVRAPGTSVTTTLVVPDVAVPDPEHGPCPDDDDDCVGAIKEEASTRIVQRLHWPADADEGAMGDVAARAALAAMRISAAVQREETLERTTLVGRNTVTSEHVSSAFGSKTTSTTYDPVTGVPTVHEVDHGNGIVFRTESEWAKAAAAVVKNGTGAYEAKNNPRALLARKTFVVAGGAQTLLGGEWNKWEQGNNDPLWTMDTMLGAKQRGTFAADGSEVQEAEVRERPDRIGAFYIGCAAPYVSGDEYLVYLPLPCRSDLDCCNGAGSCSAGIFGVGVCGRPNTGIRYEPICRGRFIQDYRVIQDRQLESYRRINTAEWFRQQCGTVTACPLINQSGRCANPKDYPQN